MRRRPRTVVGAAQVDDKLVVAVVGARVRDGRKVVVLQRGQARGGRLRALGLANDRHALPNLARAPRAASIAATCGSRMYVSSIRMPLQRAAAQTQALDSQTGL